ncbi:dual specificity protein phosphatase family protein [Shewanella avicenniae]|uniref:Dual specificity protein phosphatase family protein n=1 Tax=Shewanella avicenniae TaxID=2814294 RepID=A0ABX7QM63_9GAMM|nr:diacylglycerol kinase family protein [Shewanella avicenniae]QSX32092.1 dual specificity protein phosphatase family protein [Shewanella avicenniae]
MPLTIWYFAIAALALLLGIYLPDLLLWLWPLLLWFSLAFALVAGAYLLHRPAIFRKRGDGRINRWMRWLLMPFLLSVTLYNNIARKRDTVPPISKITDHLYLGSRLLPSDLDVLKQQGISAILDVTAEFDAIAAEALAAAGINYLNVPVLDHDVPSRLALRRAMQWLSRQQRLGHKTLVHCALGRGRSVLMLAAWLLSQDQRRSFTTVISEIKRHRSSIRLNRRQLRMLKTLWRSDDFKAKQRLWLIVNPVSGAGKWPANRDTIEQRLAEFYDVSVLETSAEISARKLAQQALQQGADVIVAGGGDGTVTEVASVLVGSQMPLGILPLGTTNALSHVLWGISAKLDPINSALDNIISGEQQRIDTAKCNGKTTLLLVGVGFEAQMIKEADREQKNQHGELAYLQGFWNSICQNQQLRLRVRADNHRPIQLTTGSLTVANGAPNTTILAQGGGFTDLRDGFLDVTWLTPHDDWGDRLFTLAELTFNGLTGTGMDIHAHHLRVKRLRIEASKPLDYVIDGETGRARKLDIRVRPASLNVLLPAPSHRER